MLGGLPPQARPLPPESHRFILGVARLSILRVFPVLPRLSNDNLHMGITLPCLMSSEVYVCISSHMTFWKIAHEERKSFATLPRPFQAIGRVLRNESHDGFTKCCVCIPPTRIHTSLFKVSIHWQITVINLRTTSILDILL